MATFKTRARAVDMLGRQQIAGIPTAISELFKNAHDAYADRVEVDYFISDGLFVLRDDGIGMTKEDFLERWLTLGTESKVTGGNGIGPPPKDPSKPERVITGEKGIGRLAIAAIGPQVLILTRSDRGDNQHDLVVAFFHWGLFEILGVNLEDIEIPMETFPAGVLPDSSDIKRMVDTVRRNMNNLSEHISQQDKQRILNELDLFDIDVPEMSRFLGELSLDRNGRGTHFYIKPTTVTLLDDIQIDRTGKDISRLRKLLLGFANTMTPNSPELVIETAFRYWVDDQNSVDLLESGEFFTPEEFEMADHHFQGEFDEFGRYSGTVTVYGKESYEYVLPWEKSGGKPTLCGPFKINVAYVQGVQRQSRIPPEDYSRLTNKLDMIGGIYIYRDGIRILPYGDADIDFLEIEKRRTKSASFYFFSYRRMFGVIQISRERNPSLEEKAGREGFQETKAYRQFKDILQNFFIQLVADFFRKGGEQAELWSEYRTLLERREKARKEAEKRGRIERRKFSRELDSKFEKINRGDPLAEVKELFNSVENKIEALEKKGQLDLFGIGLSNIEAKAFEDLRNIRRSYKLDRPMGIGLTPELSRDWMVYSGELEFLEEEVFSPAENNIQELLSDAAERMKTMVDHQHRLEQLVMVTTDSALGSVQSSIHESRVELNKIEKKINTFLDGLYDEILNEVQKVRNEVSELNIDGMNPSEIERFRRLKENEINETELQINMVLEYIRAQLKEIDWAREDGDYIISGAEMRAALEEELLALREKSDADLQLTQLGMAIEIISHEFNQTIRSIRSDLQSMKKWTDVNPKLDELYQSIRGNFEHLDGYLNLLTPLHRRLYRSAVEIKGSSIYNFINDLFNERLRENKIRLEPSESFKEKSIVGYPSTFYPVFINLVDNSIYWLKDIRGSREIHLDADENGFIVRDTGPGIQIRDREAVFEMGFTRKPGGRGLGLYISREVLNREGYDLLLDRPSDDRGALFRIVPLEK